MIIRRRSKIEQNIYHVYIDVIDPTEKELNSFAKWGEPIVNIGGTFGEYDIPDYYRKLYSQSPHHFFSENQAKAEAWQDAMEVKIHDAIETYLERPDTFVEEYLLNSGGSSNVVEEYEEVATCVISPEKLTNLFKVPEFRTFREVNDSSLLTDEERWTLYFKNKFFKIRLANGFNWSEYLQFTTFASFLEAITGISEIKVFDKIGISKSLSDVKCGNSILNALKDVTKFRSLYNENNILYFLMSPLIAYNYPAYIGDDITSINSCLHLSNTVLLPGLSKNAPYYFKYTGYLTAEPFTFNSIDGVIGDNSPSAALPIINDILYENGDNLPIFVINNEGNVLQIKPSRMIKLYEYLSPSLYYFFMKSQEKIFIWVGALNYNQFFIHSKDFNPEIEQVELRLNRRGNRKSQYIIIEGELFGDKYKFDIFNNGRTNTTFCKARQKDDLPTDIDFCIRNKETGLKTKWYPVFKIEILKSAWFKFRITPV